MKTAKRCLSVLLSLCLALGLIPGTALAASDNFPFTDVNTTDWYHDAVQYVYDKGMMSGTSATTFAPNETTSRGMIVTVLHRIEGTPAASSAIFTDVSSGQWYANAVAWASTNNIVGGYGSGLFGPGDPITREQMSSILYRYSQYKGYPVSVSGSLAAFPDAAQTSSYAVDAMNWAVGSGLIAGVSGNLDPKGSATRAQVATILQRYCENVVPTSTSAPDTSVPDTTPSTVDTTYTVTFDLNYGSDTQYDKKVVKAGETVSKPSNPSRNGYSFSGWYAEKSGGRQFDFKTGITSDLTLYAHWSRNSSSSGGNSSNPNLPETNPPETTAPSEITYKAPTESDIDSGIIEYEGQTYTARYVNNQLVVVFNDGVSYDEAKKIAEVYDASIVGKIETIGVYQVELDSAKTLAELNEILDNLKENRAVEDAYLNTVLDYEGAATQYYPDDTWDIPEREIPWDELDPKGNNWGAEAINAPSAWKLLIDSHKGNFSKIPSVRVGIIDTYIDTTHSDLDISAVYQYDNGKFQKIYRDSSVANAAAAANNGGAFEDYVHGTHVMGTIGATLNGFGTNGIALNPELFGVSVADKGKKVFNSLFGSSTALSLLIEDNNCQVINYSAEAKEDGYSLTEVKSEGEKVGKILKKYLNKNYDFLVVAAAGNHSYRSAQYSSFFNAVSDETVKSHIIVVGNAKCGDNGKFALPLGQAFGSRVDVVAPGTAIYSTVSQNTRSFVSNASSTVDYAANSKYAKLTGTSMAAPHVSGVAALVWAANPSLTGDRVKNIILETANIVVDGNDANGYSHDMVNAAYAVSKALNVKYTVQGECGENMTWTLDTTRHLTIQGTGEMKWESEHAPWHRYCKMIGNVKIGDGITSICQEAFKDCNGVINVELGRDINSIGNRAFYGMSGLHRIEIPGSVQKIGEQAFGYYDDGTPKSGFTIYGYSGTAAETYAYDEAHEGKFVFRNLTPTPPDPLKRTFQLTVTDLQTGKPISDAAVTLSGRSHDTETYQKLTSGSTDAKGMFRADVEGKYADLRADVVKDGYIAGAVETTETTASLSLSREPSQTIRSFVLTVTDLQTEKPISDAAVTLSGRSNDSETYQKITSGSTDAKGMFRADVEGKYTDLRADVVKDGYITGAVETTETTVSLSLSKDPRQEVPDGYTPIYTAKDLVAMNGEGQCILMNDIQIVNRSQYIQVWNGVLDGNGHSIILRSWSDVDVPNWIGKNTGILRNITFEKLYLYSTGGHNNSASCALVGWNTGTIENCEIASGYIHPDADEAKAAGFASVNDTSGIIRNCINRAEIQAEASGVNSRCAGASGIAYSNRGVIERCTNYGKIYANYNNLVAWGGQTTPVAGITANNDGTVTDCNNLGELSGYNSVRDSYVKIYEICPED